MHPCVSNSTILHSSCRPLQVCYYLGVKNGFLDVVMKDPEFTSRLSAHHGADPGLYCNSPHFRRLDKWFGGMSTAPHVTTTASPHPVQINSLLVSLGADFGQEYRFLQNGTGVVCIRCESLDPVSRTWAKWQKIIAMIPSFKGDDGKFHEPSSVDAHLLPLLHELQQLSPPPSTGVPIERDCHDNRKLGIQPSHVGEYRLRV